jgi:hypothetical protein
MAALLLAVYTMTNAGRFHIIDEVSLFAVTESLALRGSVDTNAIAWTQWVNSPGEVLGAFGPDGQVYSKKGPAPAFLAVPWYSLLRAANRLDISLGLVQGTLLWNGLITALTAALLWLTAAALGYGDRTGCVLALLFGLTTIAWPYAKTFFGEPLSAFGLLLTFYSLLRWRQERAVVWALIGGIGAGLAVATVTAHIFLVGALAVYGAFGTLAGGSRAGDRRTSGWLWTVAAFLGPLAAAGVFLLWYNAVRFGNPLTTGYHFESGEGFTTPILQGLWGLLISPYRGLFWHTPLFVASLVGWYPFVRRHRAEGAVTTAMSLLLIGLYSAWWMWWGGFAWGPRFLVPLTPFWVLWLAPLVEGLELPEAPGGGRRRWRLSQTKPSLVFVAVMAAISMAVQLLAVSMNFVNYEIELRSIYPTDWEDPLLYGPPALSLADLGNSPVAGQWKLARANFSGNSDLAWLWPDGNVQRLVVLVGIAVVGTLTLIVLRWWWLQGRLPGDTNMPSAPLRWMVRSLPIVLAALWVSEVGHHPHYGEADKGYRAILRDICAQAQTDDAVVTVAPFAYQVPMNWLGVYCAGSPPIYGYAMTSMEHAEARQVMEQVLADSQRVWLVTGGLAPNDAENSVERWLSEHAYKANDIWYDDYRLLDYATPRRMDGSEIARVGVPLVGDQTSQVTLLGVRAPSQVAAGDLVPVEVYYQLEAPSGFDLRWFVQLLTPEGSPAALLDTAPLDGYAAFSTLPANQELVEKAGLQLPAGLTPGVYQLIAGLYNPGAPDAARLRAPDGSDFVRLGQILVQ